MLEKISLVLIVGVFAIGLVVFSLGMGNVQPIVVNAATVPLGTDDTTVQTTEITQIFKYFTVKLTNAASADYSIDYVRIDLGHYTNVQPSNCNELINDDNGHDCVLYPYVDTSNGYIANAALTDFLSLVQYPDTAP